MRGDAAKRPRGAEDFPRPAVAVDMVVFTVERGELRVLLIERGEVPFKGAWALPGGFVRVGPSARDQGEDLDAAARRELLEETGLEPAQVYLAQLGAFGKSGRDPRMRVIAIAYYALVRPELVPLVRPGGDAAGVRWCSVTELPELAFDHRTIIEGARETLVLGLDRSAMPFALVPATFTIPELRATWESIGGKMLDPGNFRRRFQRMEEDGLVERAPGKRTTASKPAALYRFAGDRAGK